MIDREYRLASRSKDHGETSARKGACFFQFSESNTMCDPNGRYFQQVFVDFSKALPTSYRTKQKEMAYSLGFVSILPTTLPKSWPSIMERRRMAFTRNPRPILGAFEFSHTSMVKANDDGLWRVLVESQQIFGHPPRIVVSGYAMVEE
jgi:hypothetical protein